MGLLGPANPHTPFEPSGFLQDPPLQLRPLGNHILVQPLAPSLAQYCISLARVVVVGAVTAGSVVVVVVGAVVVVGGGGSVVVVGGGSVVGGGGSVVVGSGSIVVVGYTTDGSQVHDTSGTNTQVPAAPSLVHSPSAQLWDAWLQQM